MNISRNPELTANKLYGTAKLNEKQREARQAAMEDLEAFIRLLAPYQLISHAHSDLCKWIRQNEHENLLILWPRDHGKSRYSAFYAAWQVVRNPATTIIYASATAEKAEEQLRFIKSILTCDTAFRYFPGLVVEKEGQRAAWNATNIIVDHPHRTNSGVVDSTIMTCGLEKTITGKHCDKFIWDDIVVPENNTEQGRKDVNSWVAQATSILSAHSNIFAVGTRYHPKDAYNVAMEMRTDPIENADSEIIVGGHSLFKVNQKNVEHEGQFLWPRQQSPYDSRWFGFNEVILARKKAAYDVSGNIVQYYAQYYNDPNDKTTAPISREHFLYYQRDDLEFENGLWLLNSEPLFVYAALDLAATAGVASDYTALVIGDIDKMANRYLLDATRIKTTRSSDIQTLIKNNYNKWQFKKLRIEAVAGFKLVASDLAQQIQDLGIRIPVDIYVPPRGDGKLALMHNILEPLYQAGAVWHFRGGNAQLLEDELVSVNAPHDDLKDAWAMCNDLMQPPVKRTQKKRANVIRFHPKFGGIAA